jgi:signal transduction histidine kinase
MLLGILSGLLFGFAGMFLLAGVFLGGAFISLRRDREYLLFALATLAAAGYTAASAMVCVVLERPDQAGLTTWASIVVASGIVVLALVVHFALCYAAVPNEATIMAAVYGVALFFVLLVAAGGWWQSPPTLAATRPLWVFDVPIVDHSTTVLAVLGSAFVPVSVGAVVLLTWRGRTRIARGGTAIFIGSLLLVPAALNDALLLGAGGYPTVSLLPFGFVALLYGVSITLVGRYGWLSSQLEQRTEELRLRSEELEDALDELELAERELVHSHQLAVVGELSQVIEREVRTPIALVEQAVDRIQEEPAGDSLPLLTTIEREVQRLENLVTELLSFARPVTPQRQLVALNELLRQAIGIAENEGVAVQMVCAGGWPRLQADPDLLRQALHHVLSNAVQAVGEGGEIQLWVEHQEIDGAPWVSIDVVDTGVGMTEEQRAQALSPFFTTRPGGTGLGLPICARIVEAHGGSVLVESRLGSGTTVRLALPVERIDARATGRLPRAVTWRVEHEGHA